MCYIVLRHVLIFVIICTCTCKGTSLPRFVDFRHFKCVPVCQDPRPTSVVLAKEVHIMEDTAPYMVILHRCQEGSGCCPTKGTVCKVADFETLNTTFFVKDQSTNQYVMREFQVTNHTLCSCQKSSDTIK